jgi:hypothetical protein
MDDIDDLAALVSAVKAVKYPTGIKKVIPSLQRVAFFPGGTGVVIGDNLATARPGRKLPHGGTMVLGHNFSNVAAYDESIERGCELGRNPTWENLSKLLHSCGIRLSDCFFTNALLGLIETTTSMGKHAGHRDPDFRAACRHVLLESIKRQQPKLIIVLGPRARRMLGEVITGLEPWTKATTFPRFDAMRLSDAGLHLKCPDTEAPLAAVVIVHPSLRQSNLRHRRFDDLHGDKAEIAMIRRAMQASGAISS